MEKLFQYLLLGIVLLFLIWFVFQLFLFIISYFQLLFAWFKLSPQQRKNRRKMNKTVKRIKRQSKYGSSDYSGSYSFTSTSSDCSDDGGGGGGD